MNVRRLVFFFLMLSSSAYASSFEGDWRYQGNCKEGDCKAFFELSLIQRGNLLCGYAMSAFDVNSKIDGTMVVGTAESEAATLRFGSSHVDIKDAGLASLALHKNTIAWTTSKRVGGSYIWDRVHLQRVAGNSKKRQEIENECRQLWAAINDKSPLTLGR
jgi:hypothetical protein